MCDSSWPHGLQPSRLLCPWDSPGNYWSGLPCLSPGDLSDPGIKPRSPALQADSLPSKPPGKSVCVCACACVCIHASMRAKSLWLCSTLCDPTDCPWDSSGKNTGVGNHSLFQGIFPTEGLNLGLLHCRQILYRLRLPLDKMDPYLSDAV